MFIKIFFDAKPLFLCDKVDEVIEPYVHHDDAMLIDELNAHTIKAMIHEMQQANIHAGIFIHPILDELKKAFFKKFKLVKAAGGFIRDEKKDVLLIHRRGKWDLPKGKLDKGETLEECAVREVQEETGLKKVRLISPLIITHHTYHEGTSFVLKESHWYNMETDSHQALIPQTEEDIREIRWVETSALDVYKKDAFPSVVDVLEAGLAK